MAVLLGARLVALSTLTIALSVYALDPVPQTTRPFDPSSGSPTTPVFVSSSTFGSSGVPITVTSISASSASSSTTLTPLSTSSSPETETTLITIPITSYTFSPFPVPSDVPIPGVYPSTSPDSPPAPGSGLVPDFGPAWADAHAKAKQLIASWSIEEKVTAVTGTDVARLDCVGNITAVQDWPGLCLDDSPLGVRFANPVTAFPAGITVASTWNRTLLRERGRAMGEEFKGKGVNVALGPMMNMGRVPQGGRNWEGFGADPFLSGEAAYETVLGMQQGGTQACAKHFINNEQEHFRTQESSHVDDRTQHEVYLHPFMRSVMAGIASVMCSYNQVNATWACEDDRTLNQILKGELGFQGFVTTDWGAQHSTISAIAGLDMSMPGDTDDGIGISYWGSNLTAYVQNGTIPESRLDDMVERIVASWYFLGQDKDFPPGEPIVIIGGDPVPLGSVNVQADHFKVVREVAAAGTVLLKNVDGALPLKAPQSVVIIGSDSGPPTLGPNGYWDHVDDDGTLAVGWGSGTTFFPYLITPLEAIQARAREDYSSVSWWLSNWDTAGAAQAAFGNDVALVFVNANSGEEEPPGVDGNDGDRNNLTLWGNADELIAAVAGANPNTVVVVHSVGPAILEPWIENPNVTAVVWASLPGQESGNSIVDVLYGAKNPSGRLPYTIAKRLEDYLAQPVTGGTGDEVLRIEYTEGLEIDYRHFDANNIEPRFEFGFGLSYTNFTYSNLKVSALHGSDDTFASLEADWAAGKVGPASEGSSTALWLHRPAFGISFTVENTGSVTGGEIPQLYLHFPSSVGEPPSVLRGFADVFLGVGQSETITITLSRYDLSIWDVEAQGWRKPEGAFTFSVGASSRDFRLQGHIPL